MELVRDQVEALNLWRRVTVSTVRSDAPDLTARQLAVLMTVGFSRAAVRGLAATLNGYRDHPCAGYAVASGVQRRRVEGWAQRS